MQDYFLCGSNLRNIEIKHKKPETMSVFPAFEVKRYGFTLLG